jgi:hypothetical protein
MDKESSDARGGVEIHSQWCPYTDTVAGYTADIIIIIRDCQIIIIISKFSVFSSRAEIKIECDMAPQCT